MDRSSWQKILSRIIAEEIPDEFISDITIHLVDGSAIVVHSEDELLQIIETLHFQAEKEPIDRLEFGIDISKIKALTEKDVADLLAPIIKKEKNGNTKRSKK